MWAPAALPPPGQRPASRADCLVHCPCAPVPLLIRGPGHPVASGTQHGPAPQTPAVPRSGPCVLGLHFGSASWAPGSRRPVLGTHSLVDRRPVFTFVSLRVSRGLMRSHNFWSLAVRSTATAFQKALPSAGSFWVPGRELVSRSAAVSGRGDPKGADDKTLQMEMQKEAKARSRCIWADPLPASRSPRRSASPEAPRQSPFPAWSLWTLLCRECMRHPETVLGTCLTLDQMPRGPSGDCVCPKRAVT